MTEEFAGCAGDVQGLGSWQMTYEGMPAKYAVLEHVVHRVRSAGARRVVLAMERPWLAKLLLQRGREFRSVALFQRVRELHALGRNVLVLGPVKYPATFPETQKARDENDAFKHG